MRILILAVALGLIVSPALPAKNPHSGSSGKGTPAATYVLKGTFSHYAPASGATKGSITITVQTSHPKSFFGATLTFAIDSTTVVSLYGGQSITDGQYGTVEVRAPINVGVTNLQTYTPRRVAVGSAPVYPTVKYVLRGAVARYTARSGSINGSIALLVKSSNFDAVAFKGMTLTFAIDPSTKIVLHQGKPISIGDRAIVKLTSTKHSTAAALQTHVATQLIDQGSAT